MGRYDAITNVDPDIKVDQKIDEQLAGGPAVAAPAPVPIPKQEQTPEEKLAQRGTRANISQLVADKTANIESPDLAKSVERRNIELRTARETLKQNQANAVLEALAGAVGSLAPGVEVAQAQGAVPIVDAPPADQPRAVIADNAEIGNTAGTAVVANEGIVVEPNMQEEPETPITKAAQTHRAKKMTAAERRAAAQEDLADAIDTETIEDNIVRNRVSEVRPQPVANGEGLPVGATPQALQRQNENSKAAGKMLGEGQGVSEVLTGERTVPIDEISFGDKLFIEAFKNPKSGLRSILKDSGIDFNLAAQDDNYLGEELERFFGENDIELLVSKNPIPDEASAHRRIIRIHRGVGARMHPVVHEIFNADNDGDTIGVSFDPSVAQGAKSSMDFLISTEGDTKISQDFFDMVPWGETRAEIKEHLEDIFAAMNIKHMPKRIVDRFAEAIEQSSGNDAELATKGFQSMVLNTRALGDMVARKDQALASKVTARVLQAMYDHNGDIRKSRMILFDQSNFFRVGLADEMNRDAQPWDADIVEGGASANLGDFKSMLGYPVRTVIGKNIHYRIDAAFAKEIKKRFGITLNDEMMTEEEYEKVSLALVTQQMSNVAEFKETSNNIAAVLKEMVVDPKMGGVGRPRLGKDFPAWLDTFIARYNVVAGIINAAAIDIRHDQSIQSNDLKVKTIGERLSADASPAQVERQRKNNWKDARERFTKIYGAYTMEYLFGRKAVNSSAPGSHSTRLSDFASANRNPQYLNMIKDKDPANLHAFILLLADQRTSFASDYGTKFNNFLRNKMFTDREGQMGITSENWFAYLVRKDSEAGAEGSRDQEFLAILEAFNLLGPEMFDFFGLNNMKTFLTTDLGVKFVHAKSPEEMGGVFYEAIARYRWAPIQYYQKKYAQAEGDPERMSHYESLIQDELQELRSSSDTWAAIVNDYVSGGNPMEDILLKDGLTQPQKEILLNTLQIGDPRGWIHQLPFQITSELMAKPRGIYASNRFLSDFGHKQLNENITNASKKMDGYVKSNYEACLNEVFNAQEKIGKAVGTYFEIIAENPHLLSAVDKQMYADAILATLEADFNFSEKAKQTKIVNALFSALSRVTNGGLFSEFMVGDSFLMKRIHENKLLDWNIGIAKLLSDPNFKMRVFNDANPIGVVVSQETIFGQKNPTHEQIWAFFAKNPRAAMALRIGTSVGTSEGRSSQIATMSLADSMQKTIESRSNTEEVNDEKAFSMLVNHPYFGALTALTIRQQGKKRMQMREEAQLAIDRTINTLRYFAADEDPMQAAELYINSLIKKKDLSSLSADIDKANADMYAGYETSDMYGLEGPGQLIEHMILQAGKYAQMLKDAGLALTEEQMDAHEQAGPHDVANGMGLMNVYLEDSTTIRSYFNTIQMLSGAKTETDTAINANESQENAALIYAFGRVDSVPCDAPDPVGIPAHEFLANWRDPQYNRHQARTSNGGWIPIQESTIDRIVEDARFAARQGRGDGLIYVESTECTNPTCPCVRHGMADMSTNTRLKTQTTAASRFMTTLRTWASEKLNLKVKTKGDDGTDLIVKRDVFAEDWEQYEATIQEAFATDGIFAARLALAKIMQDKWGNSSETNPNALDYDAMSLDDYVNIAHYLVRPTLDMQGNETITILSISQLNALVRGAIIDIHQKNPGTQFTYAQLVNVARSAIATIETMTEESQDINVGSIMSKLKVNRQGQYRSNIPSQRQSAFERNNTLIKRIFAENPNIEFPTYKELQKRIDYFGKKYPVLAKKYPQWVGKLTKTGVDNKYSYNLLGVVTGQSGAEVVKVPGPKTLWVISDTAKPDDIKRAVRTAYNLGITVLFPTTPNSGILQVLEEMTFTSPNGESDFKSQLVQVSGNSYTLPMFDIRLNGENSEHRMGAFNVGVMRVDPQEFVSMVEDPANIYDLSDAEALFTESMPDRVHPTKTGEYRTHVSAMFGNVLEEMKQNPRGLKLQVSLATKEQIQEDIILAKHPIIDTGRRKSDKVDQQTKEEIATYINNFDSTDDEGVITSSKPNRVIAWARGEVVDSNGVVQQVVYHPIKAYPSDNSAGAPANFEITGYGFDHDKNAFYMEWEHKGSLIGQLFKFFEGGYAANKFMGRDRFIPVIKFRDGTELSAIVAARSTANRRGPVQRIQAMSTLITKARLQPWGYNLAELKGTFPNNPELKQGLLDGTVRLGVWKDLLANNTDIVFYDGDNQARNEFANLVARRCIMAGVNPSVFFASQHKGIATNLHFNYQAVMMSTNGYQNGLMTFFNDMMPEFVPPTMTDTSVDTFFNNKLQLLMPVTDPISGKEGGMWVYVYTGRHFLDEHYTGFSASGSSIMSMSLPALNTLAFGGKGLTDFQTRYYNEWGNLVPTSHFNSWVPEHYETDVVGD